MDESSFDKINKDHSGNESVHELVGDTDIKLSRVVLLEGEAGLNAFLNFYAIDNHVAEQALDVFSNCETEGDSHKIAQLLVETSAYLQRLESEFDSVIKKAQTYEGKIPYKTNGDIVRESVIPEIRRDIVARVGDILSGIINAGEYTSTAVDKFVSGFNPDAVLVETILREVRKNFDRADLNDMPLLDLITYEGGTVSLNNIKGALVSIYRKNYSDKPKLLARLLNSFDILVNEYRSLIEVSELNGKPIGFCSFEFQDDGSVHFGKFNIDPEFAGKQLGEQMLEETLDEYAITHIIRAECDRDTRIASKYIEKGFIAHLEYPLDEIICWDITRNDSANRELVTKSIDREYIMKHIQLGNWAPLNLTDDEKGTMVFAIDADRFKDVPTKLLSDNVGYAITRMFRQEIVGGGELVVVVAEKLGNKLYTYLNKFEQPKSIKSRHTIIV